MKISKLKIFLSGMAMGMAETVPGVSGGTVAFVLGIYDRFIHFISSAVNFAKLAVTSLPTIYKPATRSALYQSFWQLDLQFITYLGIGMAIAVGVFSNLFAYLLTNHPMQTFGAFFGMIIASVYAPLSQLQRSSKNALLVVVSFVLFFVLFGVSGSENTSPHLGYVFIGGAIGISAMVLPGISGSFLLLTLGLYEYVLSRVAQVASLEITWDVIVPLAAFAFGVVFGLAAFIKVLEYTLNNYKQLLLAIITGLLIASLRVLWPFLDTNSAESAEYMSKISPVGLQASTIASVVVFVLLGCALVSAFLAVKKK